jgi:hypothetical protein
MSYNNQSSYFNEEEDEFGFEAEQTVNIDIIITLEFSNVNNYLTRRKM